MLMVTACGYQYTHPDGLDILRPNGLDEFVFVSYLASAQGHANGAAFQVRRGDCLIFERRKPHDYRSLEQPYVNDWVHFVGEPGEAEALLARLNLPLNMPFRAPNLFLISAAVLSIQNELRAYGELNAEIIDADLRSLLMKLSALRAAQADRPLSVSEQYRCLFAELRGELLGSPWRHPRVEELAERASMSASHFQRTWRALFGQAVGEDMIQSRLDYAKFLLEHSREQVGQIARLCGYDSEVHFMRLFKKHVACTPSEYRQKHAGPK